MRAPVDRILNLQFPAQRHVSHVNKKQKEKGRTEEEEEERAGDWQDKESQEETEREFAWKTQPMDARAEVALLVPVSMATRMCCRCSDASREHCIAAVLTWSTRANAQLTALSIRQCLFIAAKWCPAETQAQGWVVTPRRRWMDAWLGWGINSWRALCHLLSDLCPQRHLAPQSSPRLTQIPARAPSVYAHAATQPQTGKVIYTNLMGSRWGRIALVRATFVWVSKWLRQTGRTQNGSAKDKQNAVNVCHVRMWHRNNLEPENALYKSGRYTSRQGGWCRLEEGFFFYFLPLTAYSWRIRWLSIILPLPLLSRFLGWEMVQLSVSDSQSLPLNFSYISNTLAIKVEQDRNK